MVPVTRVERACSERRFLKPLCIPFHHTGKKVDLGVVETPSTVCRTVVIPLYKRPEMSSLRLSSLVYRRLSLHVCLDYEILKDLAGVPVVETELGVLETPVLP